MTSATATTPPATSTRLTLWCNGGFDGPALELLREGTARYNLVLDGGRNSLAGADIAFGQPDEAVVISSQRLRWVHITSAGYTRYDRDDVRAALRERGAALTNSSHVFDEPCAQHALAFLLSLARRLPQALMTQQSDRAWNSGPLRDDSFLLNGQTVVLLGYGAIGRRLAELLRPLEMRVIALRRSIPSQPEENGVEVIGEDRLTEALGQADHVMNILPESPSTGGFVGADRLGQCKPVRFSTTSGAALPSIKRLCNRRWKAGTSARRIWMSRLRSPYRRRIRSGAPTTASSRRTARAGTGASRSGWFAISSETFPRGRAGKRYRIACSDVPVRAGSRSTARPRQTLRRPLR
jgi:hypothetical protein